MGTLGRLRFVGTILGSSLILAPAAYGQSVRIPVLVELFTSEGCSSCPPADALLAKLEQNQPVPGAEIIVLSEHVDYWDQLGWRDRFSSHQYTERQNEYGTRLHLDDVYTPQMVVNGRTQFVGSDERAAIAAIRAEAAGKTYALFLTDLRADKNHVSGKLRLPAGVAGRVPENLLTDVPPQADFYAALVSPLQSTAVRAGENGGRTLHQVDVVRALVRLGDSAALAREAFEVSFNTAGLQGPLKMIVFAQQKDRGVVLGAVACDLPASGEKVVPGAEQLLGIARCSSPLPAPQH